jgi:protein-S-isoprenylcysteine O-methyltransferase Ste14
MLCDLLWPLGWSLIFASVIGAALTPVWLTLIWALTQVEEESLVREYGQAYRDYQARVPRLFPRPHHRGRRRPA